MSCETDVIQEGLEGFVLPTRAWVSHLLVTRKAMNGTGLWDDQECSFTEVSFERMTGYPSGDLEFDV